MSSSKKTVTKKDGVKDAKASKEGNSKERTRSTEKTAKAEDKVSDVLVKVTSFQKNSQPKMSDKTKSSVSNDDEKGSGTQSESETLPILVTL